MLSSICFVFHFAVLQTLISSLSLSRVCKISVTDLSSPIFCIISTVSCANFLLLSDRSNVISRVIVVMALSRSSALMSALTILPLVSLTFVCHCYPIYRCTDSYFSYNDQIVLKVLSSNASSTIVLLLDSSNTNSLLG